MPNQNLGWLMNYGVALLIVLIFTGLAVLGTLVVFRTLGLDTRRRHHEVGNPVFLQVGLLFAVLLAFVFSEVWSEYNAAAMAINGECALLHGAAMMAHTMPPELGKPVEQSIVAYAHVVVNTEWPMMEHRQRSPQALTQFTAIINAVANMKTDNPVQVQNQNQIMQLVMQAHSERESRIYQMGSGLPHVIWLVIILMAGVLAISVVLAGVESRIGHIVFAGGFTGCTVMVLVLVRMLDYPFEGALALRNTDFVKIIGQISGMTGGA